MQIKITPVGSLIKPAPVLVDDKSIAEAILEVAKQWLSEESEGVAELRVQWLSQDIVVRVHKQAAYSISGLRGGCDEIDSEGTEASGVSVVECGTRSK